MLFRLLIDFDLVEFTKSLPSAQRRRLYTHFRRIQEFPGHYSDLIETDQDSGSTFPFSRIWLSATGPITHRHIKILRIIKRGL